MTADPAHIEHARKVADAVLYEGYLLYPYRRSAQKNRTRFQFGVLMPPAYRAVDEHEPSASQTECLVECPPDAEIDIGLRFLHLQRRTAQRIDPGTGEASDVDTLPVGGTEYGSFDEAVEREQHLRGRVAELLGVGTELRFDIGESLRAEQLTGQDRAPAGRLIRRCEALAGAIVARAERTAGPYGAVKLHVRVENRTTPQVPLCGRDDGLKYSLIAAHLLISVTGGSFLSMTDPPEWAAAEVAGCENAGTWPVLAGPADCRALMLSSPVILYDHPEVAPESAGDLFDATEIDEILTLRTLALTEEERREARATDQRAADLIDRLDGLPPEMLERMHGAIRYLSPGPGKAAAAPRSAGPDPAAPPKFTEPPEFRPEFPAAGTPSQPWWDPGADSSVSPETDHVLVAGVRVARGSRVRMRPGARRADAQDIFLTGREALVEAVLHDVDGQVHVAVSPVSDPLADLQRNHGRFLYFAPDEIEPVPAASGGGTDDDSE
ncbi:MAG TPA: hypothetical protein VFJ07_01105 [Streptosporangiaceae bacterium]|nr:hypothetical protein [Streptosporangiaceae bacterium]